MKLLIKSWESTGLRCPDMKVDVIGEYEKGSIVTLVQMPNGTGKTTTLDMIHAALTGAAKHWPKQKVKQYRRPKGTETNGKFVLELIFDGVPLTFEVLLDYEVGVVKYKTTSPTIGGLVNDWKPPSEIRRFLNNNFVGLFIFDGEFANKLLKPEQAEAKNAIDALCQLYYLDELSKRADEYWSAAVKRGGAKTKQGLDMWREKTKKLQENLLKVTRQYEKINDRFAELKKKVEDAKQKLDNILATESDYTELLKLSISDEQTSENYVNECKSELMTLLRQPHYLSDGFSKSLLLFREQLDKVKLPKSSSKQFFIELANEDNCICGNPIDDQAKENILEQAQKYLGEEISGVLNNLKGDIDLHIPKNGNTLFIDLKSMREKLNEAVNRLHAATSKRHAIEIQIAQSGKSEILEYKEKLEKLNDEKDEQEGFLEHMDKPYKKDDDESTLSIASLKRQLKDAKRKVDEISDTVDLGEKTRIFQNVCEKAKLYTREGIKKELLTLCNLKLEKILSKSPLKIHDINRSLILENQEGASVGQTLAVGYTFLANLLHRGAHHFPLVVDSPANPIDTSVRREIGDMVPQLCDQFIAFTISTERQGFVPALEKSASIIKFLTLFRKTDGTKEYLDSLPENGVLETKTGVLVEGRNYFYKFDLDEEPEV